LSSALGQLYKTVTLGICGHVQAPGLDALKALGALAPMRSFPQEDANCPLATVPG
jgi:hypothetical protein